MVVTGSQSTSCVNLCWVAVKRPSVQVLSPSQPLTHSCSQTLMQPRISNFFTLKVSPQILFALTSSPQTFVAVAELVKTSGTVVVVPKSVPPLVIVPTVMEPTPPGVGILIPQSCRLGQAHEVQVGHPQQFVVVVELFNAGTAVATAEEPGPNSKEEGSDGGTVPSPKTVESLLSYKAAVKPIMVANYSVLNIKML